MVGYFKEEAEPDSLIYEVYELDTAGNMKLAVTILKPGDVGGEYHMTKGHYHEDELAGETYHCLRGSGMIVMQTKDGMTREVEMLPGSIVYIPLGWAHRTVNIGDEDLILLAIYPDSAGHDYETIKSKPFQKRIVEIEGMARAIDSV
jgi:glucose-6-phosphate isomerase